MEESSAPRIGGLGNGNGGCCSSLPTAVRRLPPADCRLVGTWRRAFLWVALFLAAGPLAEAASLDLGAIRDKLANQAILLTQRYAPQRVAQPPDWALRKDPPLATVAALADSHYDDTGRTAWTRPSRDRLLKALRFPSATAKPQAVIHLGDIIAYGDVEQLRHAKALLNTQLAVPFHAVPGNHDGPGYEAVFGPRHTSFAIGGVRFIGIGITNWHWDSGWGIYEGIPWLQAELAAHANEPTLVLTHAPIALPAFANNAAVLALLDAQPQVLGVLAGHLHVDYQFPLATPHLGFPMLVRPPYGFKVLQIYPDAILIFTYEEENGVYRQANVYQRITIPARFRVERK